MHQEEQIAKISIDLIIPNATQPRKFFNEETIKELATSIKEYGILNPILVRKKDNLYEIIAGERRYRAAKLAGLTEIPVIIKTVDDTQLAAIALIENLQRENISPIEEAKSYKEILTSSNIKEQELSALIGKSQPYISNKLRLLKLPPNIQDALINKKISERHARSLISINDPNRQTELLNRIINEKLSVKELENIINEKEVTDEEIKNAIDDIMKTLNISLDSEKIEKEEKESDNMNNGNFFPNQPNNAMPDGTMSLNNMNMQTLNQAPLPPSPEVPTQPFVYNQPAVEPAPTPMAPPVPETPMPTLEVPNPMPEFNVPTAPVGPEIPSAPLPELSPMPTVEPAPTPTPEQPLFDPNAVMTPPQEPAPEQPTPAFEVPVELAPTAPQDKVTEVETYLKNNGLNYKKYSNENGHCIIIEL